jgi:hypothetical protein
MGALRVSGGFSAHHQELIKLYVQPWVLSCRRGYAALNIGIVIE